MRLNVFDDPSFDRAGHRRADKTWLQQLMDNPESKMLAVLEHKPLTSTDGSGAPSLVWLSRDTLSDYVHDGLTVLLGQQGGAGLFALDIGGIASQAGPGFLEEAVSDGHPLTAHGDFVDLRQIGSLLAPRDAHLAAYARGLTWWHARHGFCGVCGAPTVPKEAGHRRKCTNPACGVEHFPRSDPAVIMLIYQGDRCLLARQPIWPSGMHSVLAGFVEPGESLEAAVYREVAEETGIQVRNVRYHSSQPWPFPQSLMVGFMAEAVTDKIELRDDELESAGWHTRAELRALPDGELGSGGFTLPRKSSIARRLLDEWISAD
ncbi:MAG: NAD(+) diphosphatase [Pseudomonadota bacterium]